MSQERLDIPLGVDMKEAKQAFNLMNASFGSVSTNAGKVVAQFEKLLKLQQLVNQAVAGGAQYLAIAVGKHMEAATVQQQVNNMVAELNTLLEQRMQKMQGAAVIANTELLTLKEMAAQAQRTAAQFSELSFQSRQHAENLNNAARANLPAPPSAPPASAAAGGGAGGLGALIKVSAVAAGAAAMGKVGSAVKSVKATIDAASHSIGRFRLARLAGDANPALNMIKNLFENFSGTVAKVIDAVTQRIDSMVSGLGDSLTSSATSFGVINGALQRLFLMIVKHIDQIRERIQGSAFAAGTIIPGLRSAVEAQNRFFQGIWNAIDSVIGRIEARVQNTPVAALVGGLRDSLQVGDAQGLERAAGVLEGMAGKLQSVITRAGEMEAQLAGASRVVTGRFPEAVTATNGYSTAMYAATTPARLLVREIEGATRVIHRMRQATELITRPIAATSNWLQSFGEVNRQLDRQLANAPTGYRVMAKAIFTLGNILKPIMALIIKTAEAVAKLVGGVVRLVSPITNLGGAVRGTVGALWGFVSGSARAAVSTVDLAAASGNAGAAMVNLGRGARTAERNILNVFGVGRAGTFLKTLLSSKLALGAMATGAIAWGGSFAVATETATVKFGTLLRDMDQGAALVQELTTFSAVTPFSNEDLRESAGLLLAAQVPASQITDKLQMLGDIASGTSKPIGEITAVYQKMASTGKVQQDSLNQLAERGVPIYGALQSQLGVTREEMLKMVSSGEVGFSDMEAALQSLTSEGGIFAGGMAAQSQTFAGLFSTLKDNVGIMLESIVSIFMPFAKRVVSISTLAAQGFTEVWNRVRPAFEAFFGLLQAYLKAVIGIWVAGWNLVSSVVSFAFGQATDGSVSFFDTVMNTAIIVFARLTFFFETFPEQIKLALLQAGLAVGTFFADLVHWVTVAMPTYLGFLRDNWLNIFTDIANLTKTIVTNIGSNIRAVMTAIWDFIASGGTASFSVAWTPLLEGFERTTSQIPDVPARVLSDYEKALQSDIDSISEKLTAGSDEAVRKALDALQVPEKKVELSDATAEDTSLADDEGAAAAKDKGRTSFAVDSLDKGSEAALKAIFAGQQQDKTPKDQLAEAKAQTKELKAIVAKLGGSVAVAGAIA